MDYPCGHPYLLKMNFTSWAEYEYEYEYEYDMNNNVGYTPVQFFLAFHTWIRCSLVKDEQYLCFGGSSLLCKRLFHRVAYPPQIFLPLMAHGNVSSSADLSHSCLRIKHKMACI